MLLDPDAIIDTCLMHIFPILIHVAMIHIYMIHDACIYNIHDLDTCMYDACIFGLRSLTLIHVCVMHTSIIRDPDTGVYDACIHDAAYLSSMDKP